MDNLTHSLVGLVAAKAGLERLSPQTTVVCVLAANAPDSDIVTLIFGDRWSFLKHHRGITHSIVGTICLAVAIPIVFYLIELAVARFRRRPPKIRLAGLLLASMVVSATHPLMDWTNNYGIRLLLPWSPQWSYGDLVFIVDPFIWLLLGGAAFLMSAKTRLQIVLWSVLALIVTSMVILGARLRNGVSTHLSVQVFWIAALIGITILFVMNAQKRWGSRIGVAAFVILLAYWVGLGFAHNEALKKATAEAEVMARNNRETIARLVAMPTLADPTTWQCVFETERATYRFDSSLTSNVPPVGVIRYEKPSGTMTAFIDEASRDERTKVFLGFARFPVVRLSESESDCTTQTLVQFADLRYTEPGTSRGTFSLEVPVDCPGH
jgi:inner membrane protein